MHLSPKIRESSAARFPDDSEPVDFEKMEADILGAVLRAALHHCDWNRTRAARLLGLPRTTLYRKMKEYGIEVVEHAQTPGDVGEILAKYQHLDGLLRDKNAKEQDE